VLPLDGGIVLSCYFGVVYFHGPFEVKIPLSIKVEAFRRRSVISCIIA
jgi:hypothetical protein